MGITGVNHITLAVGDLERSKAFYTDLLGGKLRATGEGGAYLELGSLWLCLLPSPSPVIPRGDYTHLAFSCEPDQFSDMAGKIITRAKLWQDNTSEGESLYFLDPDGHKLELHIGNLDSRLAHYRAQKDGRVTVID